MKIQVVEKVAEKVVARKLAKIAAAEAEKAEMTAWAARVEAKWQRYFARGNTVEYVHVQVEA